VIRLAPCPFAPYCEDVEFSGISVVVLESARAVSIRAQIELAAVVKDRPNALVSFATGETFGAFFAEIEHDAGLGRIDLSAFRATHLDEFLGLGPEDRAGFANELLACAPLRKAYEEGRFFPVPSSGEEKDLRGHEAHLQSLGGVQLQFLGIGSNGHVAFSEPGTSLDEGFHRAKLAPSTVAVLKSRFAPDPVPADAVTAGPASILAAARVVMVATGAGKANAVHNMMEGDVCSACPASIIRRHSDALVLLDSAAAAGLDWPEFETASAR
jgi:glucosamine-6-phosphate deaminase